jgi:hypothetical protein
MSTRLLSQYNKHSRLNENILQKALTSAAGVAEALIPENLEKEITNTVIRLSPEMALVFLKKISGKVHEFNKLVALPRTGGAMGEAASTIVSNSQTTRDTVTLKVIRRKGEITNFLQDTSEEYIDAAAYEMENLLQQHIYDLINYIMYGNADANTYEHSGLDYYVSTNRILPVNTSKRYGDTLASLTTFDNMIDRSNRAGGAKHNRCFIMSPEMLSKLSQLLTNVRLNQGLVAGLTQVEIGGGWRLNAYRDIPIIESTGTAPTNLTNIYGTTGSSTATTGGTIAADDYFFQIAAVTEEGEQLASAEISQTTTGTTSTVTLTWEDVPNAYRYKIYSHDVTAVDKTLVRVIAADVYDAVGTITGRKTSYTFTTDPLTKDASVPASMANDTQLEKEATKGVPEYVFLWDLDPIQGLGKYPYTNSGGSKFNGVVTVKQLAETDDNIPLLVKTYAALTPSFERTSVIYRGLRIS